MTESENEIKRRLQRIGTQISGMEVMQREVIDVALWMHTQLKPQSKLRIRLGGIVLRKDLPPFPCGRRKINRNLNLDDRKHHCVNIVLGGTSTIQVPVYVVSVETIKHWNINLYIQKYFIIQRFSVIQCVPKVWVQIYCTYCKCGNHVCMYCNISSDTLWNVQQCLHECPEVRGHRFDYLL